MKLHKKLPTSINDVTSDWLTTALREEGYLSSSQVRAFTWENVGEGNGFLGEVFLLRLTFQGSSDVPSSLILKIPSREKNRNIGQALGAYEKEIRFYRELGGDLKLRTPKLFFSGLDKFDHPETMLKLIRFMNRCPNWLLAIIALLANVAAAIAPRQYVLILEDLGQFRMGDQVAGSSPSDLRIALDGMAKLHAQYWDSGVLADHLWIVPTSETARFAHLVFAQSVVKYKKATPGLSQAKLQLLDWLNVNGIELVRVMSQAPQTLIHGDFRLDNVCFDENELIVFDWQTMQAGPAGFELAYFLSAALTVDATDESEAEAVEFYRQAMIRYGVDLSKEALQLSYELGMIAMAHRVIPVFFQDLLVFGEGRGMDLMNTWIDRVFNKVASLDYEALLEKARRSH